MNLRRGLFRLWLVGAALFVLAVAFVGYGSIKREFEAAASKRQAVSDLVTSPKFADWVYQRFYSDMPRQQFDKKITAPNPITEPEVIAQLETIVKNVDTSRRRPLSEWTDDELHAYSLLKRIADPTPNPWATLGTWVGIALGIPLAVLALGAFLLWALSGFAAERRS